LAIGPNFAPDNSPVTVKFLHERNGRTVAVTDRLISLQAIKEALADFP
jgi:hypothetical protein